jgi:hypothetical protein
MELVCLVPLGYAELQNLVCILVVRVELGMVDAMNTADPHPVRVVRHWLPPEMWIGLAC